MLTVTGKGYRGYRGYRSSIVAQSLCPEDINWIRYPVHSHYHIIPIDTRLMDSIAGTSRSHCIDTDRANGTDRERIVCRKEDSLLWA